MKLNWPDSQQQTEKVWRHLYFCSHFDDAAVTSDELLRRDGKGSGADVYAFRPVHPGEDENPTRTLDPDHFAKAEHPESSSETIFMQSASGI